MEPRQQHSRPSPTPVSVKIVVADELPASALELLRAEAGWHVDARSGRSPADLAAALADADALLVRSATKVTRRSARRRARGSASSAARAPAWTTSTSPAASGRGMLVVNAPGANSISVAEHACALMLALARAGSRRRPGHEGRQVGEEEVSRQRAPRQDARASPGSAGSARKWRSARAPSGCRSSRTIRSFRATSPPAWASSCCRSTRSAPRRTISRSTCRPRRRRIICSTTSASRA